MSKKKKSTVIEKNDLPSFCDYSCSYAEFTDPNSIGACRKELAVWCMLLKKYNNKNNKCIAK